MKLSPDWMKLDVNIFTHPKVRRMRRLPEGDSIFTLWIYIMCEGMKNITNPGVIEMTAGIPCNEVDISEDTHIKLDTVRLAIKTFLELGMIIVDPVDNGAFSVKNLRKHQSIAELEFKREQTRQRVAKFREKKKIEHKNDDSCNALHDYSNAQRREEKNREEKRREDNTDSFFSVENEWKKLLRVAMDGGKGLDTLSDETSFALREIGGLTQLRRSNEFQTSALKKDFIKCFKV